MIRTNNTQRWIPCMAGSLLLLLLPACTSEADLEESRPLVVTAEIAPTSPSTRAIDATNYDKRNFEVGDEIQINNGSTSVDYRKDATNDWVSTTNPGLKVTAESSASTFSASYPKGFTSILQDQKSYQNFWQSNKLEAKGGSNVTLSNNKVNFTFLPVAVKITISIDYTSSEGVLKYKNVTTTLTGNGIQTGASSSSETIEMLHTGDNAVASDKHTFVCILYPGTWSFTLSVSRTPESSTTPESTPQTFTQSSYPFVAARNYVYNFTSSDELILNKVEVQDFETSTDVPKDPVSAT